MAVLLYLFGEWSGRWTAVRRSFPSTKPGFPEHRHAADKIQDWLKTLRKKNAVLLLATQSMADVKESPIASAILQSTATKIYLLIPRPATKECASSTSTPTQ